MPFRAAVFGKLSSAWPNTFVVTSQIAICLRRLRRSKVPVTAIIAILPSY